MTLKKTLLLIPLCLVCLTACSDKKNFEAAVLTKMQNDPDLKDYHIQPERMRDCVVETVGANMPGLFFADPERLKAYQAYTKMLTLKEASDPQKMLAELRNDFGSAKGLTEANRNFSESVLLCQTALTSESDAAAAAAPPATTPTAAPSTPATESPAATYAPAPAPAATQPQPSVSNSTR